MMTEKQNSLGFTLLEVLITMGVLTMGLLGLASLQIIALKSSSSVQFYSQANNLAYSIIDTMRVNHVRAIAGDYNTDFTTTTCIHEYDVTNAGTTIAEQDLANWINTIACTLPNGSGSIQVYPDGNNMIAVIIVQWDNSREQSNQSTEGNQSTLNIQVVSYL